VISGTGRPSEVIGLCFHGIGAPAPGAGQDAAEYFISRDLFLAVLDDVMTRPEVDLTFDDGYASDVEIALPALVQRGLTARFFPLAGRLGKSGHLDESDVRVLAAAGMPIGSHGMRHRSWRRLDTAGLDEELDTARSLIADAAGGPVTTAACPFGEYDRQVLSALRHHGYRQVFTSDRRRAETGRWLQPRYSVRQGDTMASISEDILTPRPLRERLRGSAAGLAKAWR
jgi:peptidoglycan/xylan/chitin deacetylase (PgdA/CDA1 family)